MIRAFAVFILLYTIVAGSIFLWREIQVKDVAIAGKLIISAIITAGISFLIYFGET